MKKIDVSGKDCPVPVLQLQNALSESESGEIIELKFTCPEAVETLPAYCVEHQHQIISFDQLHNDGWLIKIKKG
ncbi:sulfurtransferase TusA family protein [Xylocopilactobacillus apicola]|uniref:UPF0033 domain-containing protein n=1 Tax=Xylocopilactobacillus apicola TaxID=2932184 RepID=A0AAU9D046_9LACO|nr:sulfurtransferase TusA family protein [Xylocopilactobacillus apicola]BDR59647.1 hypothetical protein XA3_20880 [Xylocopilactobacillus apicola]